MDSDQPHRVLLIDDDAQLRRLYPRFFGAPEYETRVAEDGGTALEIVAGWRPDIILLDLVMKVRGTAVVPVLRIHPNSRDALIIAFSGAVTDADREQLRAAGFDDVIPKGQEAGVVVARVRQLLEQKRRG
jgi:DNA-binding response OmpR family regulator